MSDLPRYIGPFEVRDRLGHGGMGMVYLAYDPMLDRSVAVKVLRVPDDETRRRFLREARLHAKVQHPHIVNIYAVGEHEGQPYLAMEYIAGNTLAAIIRNGDDVPLARKVTWLAELSAGLDHAHRYGVVHRDVKPSNILVTRETGRLRLLDFGIAHGQEALGMTMAGMVIGTPQYMSPEQITGRQVDARSDIFSVGLVGYELLTGRQAFGGDNVFDISRRIVGEPPPALASGCRDAPTSLLRIIEKCLEKSPDDRYQEGRQLERELLSVARRLDPDHTLVSVPMAATALLESHEGPDDQSTAAARLASRVREAVSAGQLSEAEQLLRDLQLRHALVPGLSGLRVLVEEARQMSQAVDLAADAERALARAHLTEAQALIDDIERLAPTWAGVSALRRELQARQNERRVGDVVRRVTADLDAGRLDAAEPGLRELADLSPAHPELGPLRSRYHGRIAEQQAASLASRARIALQQDELDDAAALVAEALAIAPQNVDALSVQALVGQRRRARRLARAAQKVQAALEAAQPVAARQAYDQLMRLDAAHPDLDALRLRVERLERGEESDTTAGPRPLPAAFAAAPLVLTPAPAAAQPLGGNGGAPVSPFVAPAPGALDDADDLPMSHPSASGDAMPHDAGELTGDRRRPAWFVAGVAALVLMAVAAGIFWYLRPRPSGGPAVEGATAHGGDGVQLTEASGPGSSPALAPADPGPVTAAPVATTTTEPDEATTASPRPPTAAEQRRRAQQLAANGRYPEALAALDQTPGLSRTALEGEQRKVADAARERAEVARRTASDFRAGTTGAFIEGGARMQQGDDNLRAGNIRQAVLEFARAHEAFMTALATRATQAGVPAPTVPAPAAAAGPSPASPAASAPTPAQARAVVAQYRQAYEAKSITALQRLWPSMEPATERGLRGIFGIPGELQWIPLDQKVIPQPDQGRTTVSATVMTVTPLVGGESARREVTVTIDVVAQNDTFVIAALRQR